MIPESNKPCQLLGDLLTVCNRLIFSDLCDYPETSRNTRDREALPSVVEAAGIEPASEKGHRKEPTCLVHSKISTSGFEWTSHLRPSLIGLGPRTPGGSPKTYLAR